MHSYKLEDLQMTNLMVLLWPFVCAFLNRVRGGLYGDKIRELTPSVRLWGTTTARLSTTGSMLLPILYQEGLVTFLLAWLSLYVGFIFGWKAWQSVETVPNDIFALSLRGLLLTAPMGLIIGSFTIAGAGLLMGPIYYLGKFLPPPQNNVEWGEWIFGGTIGAAIILGGVL
jgi:hypothetical protein